MNIWDKTIAFKQYAMKLMLIYYHNEMMELRFYLLNFITKCIICYDIIWFKIIRIH